MVTLQALMSSPGVQARLLNLLAEIDDWLHHPDFLNLIRDHASGSSFRFFMKGSSAVRLYVATGFPLPLTSDFDMVLLIDPMLPAYRTIRALLIQRLLEFFDAAVANSAGFFDMEPLPADVYSESQRVYNGSLKDDLPSFFDQVFKDKGRIPISPLSSFIYVFTNNLISPNKDGSFSAKGFSLLKVLPRLSKIDSVLDIIIPSRDYANVYHEWAASEDLTELNLRIGNQTKKIYLLNPFLLDADLRQAEQSESRAEKLKTRRELISLLEVSRLRQLL